MSIQSALPFRFIRPRGCVAKSQGWAIRAVLPISTQPLTTRDGHWHNSMRHLSQSFRIHSRHKAYSFSLPIGPTPVPPPEPSLAPVRIRSISNLKQNLSQDVTLIDAFFRQFETSEFAYDPNQPVICQFDDLCRSRGWDKESEEAISAHRLLVDALVAQFGMYYGVNAGLWEPWEKICEALKIPKPPPPCTLESVITTVIQKHFSIIDLIEHQRIGTDVPLFQSSSLLQTYLIETRREFPAHHPAAGAVLRYLMTPALNPNSHIDQFFLQPEFAAYPYDPTQDAIIQFRGLTQQFRGQWSKSQKKLTEGMRRALVLEFNDHYGTDENSLESWVGLCLVIGIKPIPDTMVECRKAVAGTHVNIVDLITHRHTGAKVEVFNSVKELSNYTLKYGRQIPQNDPQAGGVIHYLLREIDNPSKERYRNRIKESLANMHRLKRRKLQKRKGAHT